jgi:feruloyl esterase
MKQTRQYPKHFTTLALLAIGLSACGGGETSAATNPCTSLAGQTVAGAAISRATTVAASGGVGEYCRVEGSVRPGFNFEVHLPTQWNNKLVQNGGGGWDGVLQLVPQPSISSYVRVASNGGHVGDPLDASWALNNTQAKNDFGYLAPHTTLGVAKELVRRRYGRDAQRHYFQGCSNGGREALIQASRYPADYDGILAVMPAVSFTEMFQAFIRNAQAYSAPGAAINAAKARTIANAVVARCDAADGLQDGLVGQPWACNFDPGALQCTGADNDSCLTAPQVAAARTIYSEYRLPNGTLVYPGWSPGGEDIGWPGWIGNPPAQPLTNQFTFADGMVRYWLANDPGYNTLANFSPANFQPQLAAAAATLDASPNLTTFFAQGRKLVLVHGTHDWAISYKGSVKYFVEAGVMSGGDAVRDANMELFLLPGVQHCGGGVGPFYADYFDATVQWVEANARPSSRNLVVFGTDANGQINRTRPLCRFPTFARYIGGNPALATSFTCSLS